MTAAEATRQHAAVQHFHQLGEADRHRLFFRAPEELAADADRDVLATALGATLYMPADRSDLAAKCAKRDIAQFDLTDFVAPPASGQGVGEVGYDF